MSASILRPLLSRPQGRGVFKGGVYLEVSYICVGDSFGETLIGSESMGVEY